MVDFRNRLRHAIVISVFSLEGKRHILPDQAGGHNAVFCGYPKIRSNPAQYGVAIRNETQGGFVRQRCRCWRSKYCLHELVIQVWRTDRELGLLQSLQPVMVP